MQRPSRAFWEGVGSVIDPREAPWAAFTLLAVAVAAGVVLIRNGHPGAGLFIALSHAAAVAFAWSWPKGR